MDDLWLQRNRKSDDRASPTERREKTPMERTPRVEWIRIGRSAIEPGGQGVVNAVHRSTQTQNRRRLKACPQMVDRPFIAQVESLNSRRVAFAGSSVQTQRRRIHQQG